jgi:Bacterial Ig-like domain (group 3)/FG-GAP-like repeat
MRPLVSLLIRIRNIASTPVCFSLRTSPLSPLLALVPLAAMFCCAQAAHAVAATTVTTLTLTSAGGVPVTTVPAGTAVILTATVKAGATALTAGQVFLCDASAYSCGYSYSLGSAQLTSAGSAKLAIIPAPGTHSYKAFFTGTASNAASTSANVNLAVTASIATSTTVTASSTAPYTLTGAVTGIAGNWPSGTVTFTDTTNSLTLGKQTLISTGSPFDLNAGATYSLPPASDFILSADFNGDGKLDLAVPITTAVEDAGIQDGVAILLGNGDGTFAPASIVGVTKGSIVDSIVAGDFNGDGKLDLATGNNALNTVTILLGHGDGTFTVGSSPAAGTGPIAIVTADFNRDGKADLAIANYSGPITILLGNGDGTFTAKSQTLGANSVSLVVADWNGDGIADLAVADGTSYVDILLGNGDGTFSLGTPASTVADPRDVVTGDFNGDGKADLAAAGNESDSGSLTVLLGNGDGTFTAGPAPAIGISTDSDTGYLAAADINGDGASDLVLVDFNHIYELIWGGNQFVETMLPGATSFPDYYTVAIGDFNGDGLADIVTQNSDTVQAAVYLSQLTANTYATLNNVSIPGGGKHTVRAAYGGSTEFAASSATVQLTAAPLTDKLSLTANPTTPSFGTQVLLTATLAPYSDGTLLTNGETVTFKNGTTVIGTGTLSSGVATLNISSLPAGSDSITASYPGDTNFAAATAAAVTVTVSPSTPVTWYLGISPYTGVVYNQTVTLTATISSSVFLGRWWITEDSLNCTTNGVVCGALSNAIGPGFVYVTSPLTVGTHTFYLYYSATAPPNNQLPPTEVAEAFLIVGKATPTITWVTPTPIVQGTPLSSTQLDATASVPGTFTYTPASGTILSAGAQTLSVTFTPTDTADYTTATATVTLTVDKPGSDLEFIPITPCRIADTRNATGAFGGPELAAGVTRTFNVPQSACGIPSTAAAFSLNITVVPDKSLGYLTMWPAGQAQPAVSTLNSDGRVKANAAIVPAGTNGGVSLYASDATQAILDIDGYFVPAGTASALQFYPVAPCRIADTRNPAGADGGPSINGNTSRSFPVEGVCNIPSSAEAYSLNVTAVPHSSLGYLTVWPAGESQPGSSTLNATTGAVTANAAIVPAGSNGEVSVYASDAIDVILDVNGYFAAPSANGLSLYTVTPCRVVDTRNDAGAFTGTLLVDVETSACAPSSTAKAYVLNATAVPSGSLGYISLWPAGESQPGVSTLNASDGAVTSNMAIVPTQNGSIDAYAASPANLILDISSYFAP